ncbi:HGGxSTG domain-containing protein [Lysobacter rhizosphaerae]
MTINKCGAQTRKGTPCQAKGRLKGGRCKWHGGCSTGPRSREGKALVTMNLPRVRAARSAKALA